MIETERDRFGPDPAMDAALRSALDAHLAAIERADADARRAVRGLLVGLALSAALWLAAGVVVWQAVTR